MKNNIPRIFLSKGSRASGFVVEKVNIIKEIPCVAYRLKHIKSGARLLHLHANDKENLFCAAFRTPPQDNTGLPHILEHTVLCGSKKYPVKDPFVELLRTSLATFLNAMTYPDRTVYPCSSMNKKDFFNLTGVYCDAVFYPLITELHFRQEGHHLEFTEPGDINSKLTIRGVVYNEMKGALSDLDGIIENNIHKIFPDNAYGYNSGGDPDSIPSLTYEQFKNFHTRYYHPSNAFIFIYGNIPTKEHLAFLDKKYLSKFKAIKIDSSIAGQPKWRQPREETIHYPVGSNEDTKAKTAVSLTFLANPITNILDSLAMGILGHYLLNNAASPLRKALIDSKLGHELSDSGYVTDQRDTFFTVGLKGTEPEHTKTIEKLIFDTCCDIARKGIDKDKIEASFHCLELAAKMVGNSYPLHLLSRVTQVWLYNDKDPLAQLNIAGCLDLVRNAYKKKKGFFESYLKRFIINNTHRCLQTFIPDPSLTREKENLFEAKMAELKAKMSPAQLTAVARETAKLVKMQNTPNSAKALSTLPKLALSDISKQPVPLPVEESTIHGRPVLRAMLHGNGINYLNISVDLRGLPDELMDFLSIYSACSTKMGAGPYDYASLIEREAASTGGVSCSAWTKGSFTNPYRVKPFLTMSSLALDSKLPKMLDILLLRLIDTGFTDINRLKDVIRQDYIHAQSSLVPGATSYALSRAHRHLSQNSAIAERIGGISQVRLLNRLSGSLDHTVDEIIAKMGRIRTHILTRERFYFNFLGSDTQFAVAQKWIEHLLSALPSNPPPEHNIALAPFAAQVPEAIALPADVAFSACAVPAVSPEDPHAPSLLVLAHMLTFGPMWNEIREKGGAYGCSARFSGINSSFALSTYRDPNINRTIKLFGRILSNPAACLKLSRPVIQQAVIGVIRSFDQPIRPASATSIATDRYLSDTTPARLAKLRESVLSVTPASLSAASSIIAEHAAQHSPLCVISSREKLEQANAAPDSCRIDIQDL